MELHANAALSLKGRRSLARSVVVDQRTLTEAAAAAGVSVRCARKWVSRYRQHGESGLCDRSSAPHHIPHRTSQERVDVICQLRRLRFTGPEIAETLTMPLSTVSAVLKRSGMGRLGRLGLEPAVRYEHTAPGELIHIDVKKLGRISAKGAGFRVTGNRKSQHHVGAARKRVTGWEFVHVAIDDYSRLAYVEILPDERSLTAVGFLKRATAFYARHGITVKRLITDNGGAYISVIHTLACRQLGIRHIRTRPRRPQTNGKAERFIRTMLSGWAYGAIYGTNQERTQALDGWLWHYNHQRRHSAIGHQAPITRVTKVSGTYT
jgi:transposase InsO family protein